MSALPPNIRERLDELLVAQTLGELSAAERAELDTLLANPEAARLARETEAAAAALLLAFKDEAPARMPADAKARLFATGRTIVGPSGAAPGAHGPGSSRAAIGWLIAAALAVVAAVGWLRPPRTVTVEKPVVVQPPAEPTAAERFAALLADPATRTVTLAAQADPAAQGVTGQAVWNNEKQQGFLKLQGLAVNDPAQLQYQLWIFDGTRETYPVDGGVFDIQQASIDPATGEAIIPMRPKLSVGAPAAFAITIEKPGGVVVTDKSRLLLLGAAQ